MLFAPINITLITNHNTDKERKIQQPLTSSLSLQDIFSALSGANRENVIHSENDKHVTALNCM